MHDLNASVRIGEVHANLGDRTITNEGLFPHETNFTNPDAPRGTVNLHVTFGEVHVDLVQHQRAGKPDRLGHGYLISDYPLTRTVIETREPRSVYAPDPDADPAETSLLRELGFDSLLMLPIEADDAAWGLVEVYGSGRPFEVADVEVAQRLVAEVDGVLQQLARPAR